MPRPAASSLRLSWALVLSAVSCCAVAKSSMAQEPLHEQIDRLIEADSLIPVAPPASDAEFLRRASLDFLGRIPSAAEARDFAADQSPAKRGALIDRLLASPEYARHMAGVFDVALMERRPEKSVPVAEWQRYLHDSFAANKPYDQLVREILSADGFEADKRAPARFFLDREGEPNLLTRDVGRIFLGMDLQCAQCHDHPLISDYYQSDYQGLYAFFNRTTLFTDKEKKVFLAEKADGDVTYQSVFDATRKGVALPQLPGGEAVPDQTFAKGEEYLVAPAENVRPVPKYSRRAQLAGQMTGTHNRQFDRTIVNRLWAYLLGRGLIDPVDLDHGDNPPSHPAVLALLADAFPAMKYDIKALLAQIARTRAYGRSLDLPAELPGQGPALAGQLESWETQRAQLAAVADKSQEAAAKVGAELTAARTAADPVAEEVNKAKTAAVEAEKNSATATKALADAQAALPGKQEAARLVAEANAKTAEAAQKLPDDKELADAAAKLKTRSEQLAAEVATLTKTTTEGPAAVQATGEALAAAQQTLAAAQARLEPLQSQVNALRQQAKSVDAQARADRSAQAALAARMADAKAVVTFAGRVASIDTTRAAAAAAADEVTKLRQVVVDLQPTIDQATQALATAQQSASTTAAALAEVKKSQAEQQATLDAVREALAKTEIARQRLPQATELAQAVESLKAKSEQLATEAKSAETQLAEHETAHKSSLDAVAAAQQALDAVVASRAQAVEKATAAEQAAATVRQKVDGELAAADVARREVTERFGARGAVAVLKHLSPEQLAMSMMQASGVIDRERAAVAAEWEKNHPTPDAAAQAARAAEIDKALAEKLKPSVQAYVSLFAAGPGQPQQAFQATVDQALFLANGGQVRSWLAQAEGNLTDRVTKLAEPAQAADELYVSVLSRRATDVEAAEVATYLAGREADRAVAVQELAWALFCSAEFRFNH